MSFSPVRVLVVDDSAYLRKVMSEMLNRSTSIQVVGTASSGADALEKAAELQPDVITLDLFMPGLSGVNFLKEQMARKAIPVVICSIATQGGEEVVAAIEAGAIEFVRKPTALFSEQIYQIADDLIQKVLTAAHIPVGKLTAVSNLSAPHLVLPEHSAASRIDAVVIGISTGGPQALRYLLPQLPGDFPAAIAIVLHMPVGYTGPFAQKLNEISEIEVLEAENGLEMKPGRTILARAGYHLTLDSSMAGNCRVRLDLSPENTLHRPSADVLFRSAAETYGMRTLGAVMTGMGNDGTAGAAWIKAQGGLVLAEAEESCVVYGMPRSVVESGLADHVVPLSRFAQTLMEVV